MSYVSEYARWTREARQALTIPAHQPARPSLLERLSRLLRSWVK